MSSSSFFLFIQLIFTQTIFAQLYLPLQSCGCQNLPATTPLASNIHNNNGWSVTNDLQFINGLIDAKVPGSNELPIVNSLPFLNEVPISDVSISNGPINNALPVHNGQTIINNGLPINNGLSLNNGFLINNGLPINNGQPINALTINNGVPTNNGLPTNNGFSINNGLPSPNGIVFNSGISNVNGALINNGVQSANNMPINNGFKIPRSLPMNGLPTLNNGQAINNGLPANNIRPIDNTLINNWPTNQLPLNSEFASCLPNNGLLINKAVNNGFTSNGIPMITQVPLNTQISLPNNMPYNVPGGNFPLNEGMIMPGISINSAQPNANNIPVHYNKIQSTNCMPLGNLQMPLNNGLQLGNLAGGNLPNFQNGFLSGGLPILSNLPFGNIGRGFGQASPGNVNLPNNMPAMNMLHLGEFGNFPILSGLPVAGITETITVLNPSPNCQNIV